MADIKTKDALKGTIKQLDKAAMVGDRMRTAYIATKEKAEHSVDAAENNPGEYASDRVENAVDRGTHEAVHQFDKAGRKGVETTKQNISKAKDGVQKFKERRAEQSLRQQTQAYRPASIRAGTRTAEHAESTIKQSAHSAGKQTIKTTQKATVKTAQKSVKTAEKTAKTTIKTTQQAAKATQRAAQATVKATQRAAQAAKATAKAVVAGVKAAIKATISAVKTIIAATKALVAAIAAGGWVAVIAIIVICLIAAVAGSFYGIFFSGEDSGNGNTIKTAITEINQDYNDKIADIKTNNQYDQWEINGITANWKDVLAIYSVKTTTDSTNPMEVATVDDDKKAILSSVFWDMNELTSKINIQTDTVLVEEVDDDGETVLVEQEVQTRILEITISSKTADTMASEYSFNSGQRDYLTELMDDKNNTMWNSLIFNLHPSGSGIDIGSLTFENETVNDTQKKIVSVAINSGAYGISATSGYCQAWVADVYQIVFGSRGYAHCAMCAANSWGVSSDWSSIPVGATVYGYSNSQYGHVGIYIGNGKVAHNIGEIVVESLDSWVEYYKGFCWGYENGQRLQ